MDVKIWPLADIIPYETNPRVYDEAAIAEIADSLHQFGWQQPIVVEPNGVIIVGHRRRLAALKLGLSEAPVHVAHDLSAAQIKAYRLRDNKSHEGGKWAEALLTSELIDLSEMGVAWKMAGFEDRPLPELAFEDSNTQAPAEARLTQREGMVECVFYMADVPALEKALKATGEKNRAKALAKICHAYLNPLAIDGLELL